MSTLQVNNILSYTPSEPVSITDSFKVSGSTQLSGSVSIDGNVTLANSHTLTAPNFINTGTEVTTKITGSFTGSFTGALTGPLNAGSSSATTVDLGSTTQFYNNNQKIQLRLTLGSSIADGAQAGPFILKCNKINADSSVIANIAGPVSGGAASNSISASIVSTFVEANSCSIFLNNETGQTIGDNTTFTCSIFVIA